ncbi:MAG: glycerate kinase [Bryobacteraceae bacterium]
MNLRRSAVSIFRAALAAADPAEAIRRHVSLAGDTLRVGKLRFPLDRFRHVYVVGAGKAAATMGKAVEKLLGSRITSGHLNTKHGHTAKLKRIRLQETGHPVPDLNGIEGSREIARIVTAAGRDDLVLCLFSGGASALMPFPAEPVTLAEKQETTKWLLACGASIHEINAVRKHISAIKGGQLARLAAPATVVSLLLSDVIGDDLDVIGSGPTAPDSSTFQSAWDILRKYQLQTRVPPSVRQRIETGLTGVLPETPKANDPVFARTHNLVIGSNRLAVEAAARKARELGFRPIVLSTFIEGETRDVARMHAAIAKQILATGEPVKAPACVITGGETTVTIRGDGKGGRNQEFCLAAAIDLAGLDHVFVLSGGTDGTDGPTDAAGALADGSTVARGERAGLRAADFFARNDSYPYFEAIGDLLKTGPTGTNVMDVRLVLVS